jgi:hypothetical protein
MCHNTEPEEYEVLDERTGSVQRTEIIIRDVAELPVLTDEEIMAILNLYKHE